MKKLFLFASVAALLGGCSKETTEDAAAPVTGRSAIYATYDDGSDATRTVAQPDGNNGYYLYWELGDAIGVFDAEAGDSTNEYFAYTGSDGVFLGDKGFLFGEGYVAYYPYKENRSISATGEITLNIPAEQKYRTNAGEAGSFAQNVAPAVAYGKATTDDKLHLTFRPVATYMRVPIIGEGTVKTLELRIKRNGEYIGLAGDVKLNIADIVDDVTTVAPATGDYTETAITLICHKDGKGGVVLDPSEPKYFWFVIPGSLTWQNETVEFTVNDAPNKLTRTLDYASPKTTKVNGAIVMGQGSTVDASGKSVAVPFEWHEGAGSIPDDMKQAFPDPIFREYVLTNFDTDKDGKISEEEAEKVRIISVSSKGITSLEGIQYFTNLEELNCDYNQLTSLDVSKNTALTILWCASNQLTSLDVSKNTALEDLVCASNQLTSLDVSKNTALTYLYCHSNQLTSLDVSKNTALEDLVCRDNLLTSLDVSKNTMLEYLTCGETLLTSLDVSKNTALTSLWCPSNQLTSLDVSNNTALTSLWCPSNQLISLDVSNNTALTILGCASNQLTSLDVSNNTKLTQLFCASNQLTSLDVSNNTALEGLNCYSNQLTSLDVSKNTKLTELMCSNNQLTSLDVSKNTALTYLYCESNQLTSLDLSKNTALTILWCASNQLTSLDVSKTNLGNSSALFPLLCSGNPLEKLYLKSGREIRYITSNRDSECIPDQTEIIFVD